MSNGTTSLQSAAAAPTILNRPQDHQSPLRALYDYWRRRCATNALPARNDIDPRDLGTLLPDVALVDVMQSGLRFRLMGTRLGAHLGRDCTGGAVRGLASPLLCGYLDRLYGASADERCAFWSEAILSLRQRASLWDWNTALHMSQVVLPLADDSGAVDMLLVGWRFSPANAPNFLDPVLEVEVDSLFEAGRTRLN